MLTALMQCIAWITMGFYFIKGLFTTSVSVDARCRVKDCIDLNSTIHTESQRQHWRWLAASIKNEMGSGPIQSVNPDTQCAHILRPRNNTWFSKIEF